jgi:hypothetical protein
VIVEFSSYQAIYYDCLEKGSSNSGNKYTGIINLFCFIFIFFKNKKTKRGFFLQCKTKNKREKKKEKRKKI